MNANLTNARKAYFEKVHRIQRDHKCTFTEAKKIYNQNGKPESAPLESLTPDSLVALAQGKVDEITAQINACQERIGELRTEVGRWSKLANAMSDAVPNTRHVENRSGWDGPPPSPPKGSYAAVG